jgi:hypothetical protein
MENKEWQCQRPQSVSKAHYEPKPSGQTEDCQIDHKQTSPNNESLLRKCSICKTIKSHSNFVKSKNQKCGIGYMCYDCKKRQNDKFTCNIKGVFLYLASK